MAGNTDSKEIPDTYKDAVKFWHLECDGEKQFENVIDAFNEAHPTDADKIRARKRYEELAARLHGMT